MSELVRAGLSWATVVTLLFTSTGALADAAAPAPPASTPAPTPTPTPAPTPTPDVPDNRPFKIDLFTDGTIIGISLGFGLVNNLIESTGEIRPQRPVDPSALLGIDSIAVTQTFDPHATSWSNAGLYTALGFAALDPVLSGLRDGPQAALVDATLYAESLSATFALTELAKIAVRRPRPSAYVAQAALDKEYGPNGPSITDTDQSLSFFSGHSSICAATTATATYLAFSRSPGTWRPWVTLAIGTLVTTGVAIERVRAGAHFPTDVIAGALAGTGVGVLVPQLHRRSADPHATWIALTPEPGGLGLSWQGLF